MTEYTVISRYRNKEAVESLVKELEARGKTSHNFCATPADPDHPDAPPEEQMKRYEALTDFFSDPHIQYVFEKDLKALKEAEKVILLLPGGTSAHIEAGIAYGLGKPLILIGTPEKPESLYLMFKERYATVEDFLKTIQ